MKKLSILLFLLLIIGGCSQKAVIPINSENFFVIAHRGASTYAPENTMFSYEIAKQSSATYIEIDLQMTKDGVLVAMHDETVNRTTNGNGLVKEYTLRELKQLNAGKWFNRTYPNLANLEYEQVEVPTLEEIILRFGDNINYYIEMKSPGIYDEMEEKLIDILQEYNLIYVDKGIPKVIIQSFNEDSLAKFHQLEPRLPLMQLFSFKEEAALSAEDYKRLNTYASGIGVNINSVNKNFIREVQKNGLQVHLFNIKNEVDFMKAFRLNANAAFTDSPRLDISLFKQFKEQH